MQRSDTGRWCTLALACALLLQLVISFYFFWILPTGDEALHVYNASRVAQGQWPYVDFFAYITPGTYLLGGAVLVSQKVILLRLLMAALAIAGIVLMHRIIGTLVRDGLARIAWLAVYVSVTALSATYFSHHNIDQFLLVALLYLAVRYSSHRRLHIMLGTVVALDSFVHQSHGAYYFLAIAMYILLLSGHEKRERLIALWYFALPSAILYAVFGAFLALSGGLLEFIHDTVIWIVSVYGKFLAFGYFEDTIFYIRQNENIPEQIFFLVTKTAVLAGVVLMSWRIAAHRVSDPKTREELLPGIILLAAVLGHLQTMHNAVSYYALFYAALGVYLLRREFRWTIYIAVACTLVQLVRVASFPIRHAGELLAIPGNLDEINGNYFYRSEQTGDIAELGRLLEEHGIRQAVVVNRSPELYFLLGISNPTRHDVILPVYLSDDQLGPVLERMKFGYIIYDRALERIKTTADFFDSHHYKNEPARFERIEQSKLFSLMRNKRLIFETGYYAVYG